MMDKRIMNKNEFLDLLKFYENKENVGKCFWETAQFYCTQGYLDACTVYRVTADVFCDGSDEGNRPKSWINIYELNSDIIIRLIEDEIDLDDLHRTWIKDSLNHSYYRKMYYFLHYSETTPDWTGIKYSFLLDNIFTELDVAIIFALAKIRDYDGDTLKVIFNTNKKALEYLDIFGENAYITDDYLYKNLEILALYKEKNSSKILKIAHEIKKIEDAIDELDTDEYILLYKKNSLDKLFLENDKKQKELQELVNELEQKKEFILREKFILERDIDRVKQNILNIETKKDDLLNTLKLLE